MDKKFSFAQPFLVYLDGKEIKNVTALQLTRNCKANENIAENKITVYYQTPSGKERILTTGLEEISFDKP